MTFPRIWIAWLLALVFGFAAPAQAMRGLTGLGTPLGAKSHRVDNPINFSDPDGLEALQYGPNGTTQTPTYHIRYVPRNSAAAASTAITIGIAIEAAPAVGAGMEYAAIRTGLPLLGRAGRAVVTATASIARACKGGYVKGPKLTTNLPTSGHHANQLNPTSSTYRGWDQSSIDNVVNNPVKTGTTVNAANGNPATAYFSSDNQYVVRDNVTGDLVQTSNLRDPNWLPDSRIQFP